MCQECKRPIGGAAVPVAVRYRTRADYSELEPGELGAWCRDCKRLTVYVVEQVA